MRVSTQKKRSGRQSLSQVLRALRECERRARQLRRKAIRLGLPMTARGMGSLYLRSDTWWLAVYVNGQRVRISTGIKGGSPGHPPKEAELFRATKLLELGRGGLAGLTADTLTVREVLDLLIVRYRAEQRPTVAVVECRLKRLVERYGSWKVKDFTMDRILAYAVMRRDQDRAAIATINLELAYLRRAFAIAVECGRLTQIPRVPRLPGTKIRQGFIEPAQFEAILDRLPKRNHPPIRFLAMTGWRLSEALAMEWRQVGWLAEEIRLPTSKTGEPRALPFSTSPDLRDLLLEQRRLADELQVRLGIVIRNVFFTTKGRPLGRKTLQGAWARARVKAGWPNLLIHDLRRTVVRDLERAGVSRSAAMAITGHRSEVVYRRYAIVARQDVEEAMSKLRSLLHNQSLVGFPKKSL